MLTSRVIHHTYPGKNGEEEDISSRKETQS